MTGQDAVPGRGRGAHIPLPDPVPGYPANGVPCGICGLPTLLVRTSGEGDQGWSVGCPRCRVGVRQTYSDRELLDKLLTYPPMRG